MTIAVKKKSSASHFRSASGVHVGEFRSAARSDGRAAGAASDSLSICYSTTTAVEPLLLAPPTLMRPDEPQEPNSPCVLRVSFALQLSVNLFCNQCLEALSLQCGQLVSPPLVATSDQNLKHIRLVVGQG